MRMLRVISVTVIAVTLAVAACEGASKQQGGDADQQGAGQAPEQGQGTVANDTAPHRPGAPTPNTISDENEDNSNQSEGGGNP